MSDRSIFGDDEDATVAEEVLLEGGFLAPRCAKGALSRMTGPRVPFVGAVFLFLGLLMTRPLRAAAPSGVRSCSGPPARARARRRGRSRSSSPAPP